ncbi:lipoate--protein ligase [Azotosporobacter soli]|uniref:lipoate--protein ligase n=1 Tax=Azotosporobacter soli TaxID=3055040 RepID=UPI0031FEDF3C
MLHILNASNDPCFNLALEEYYLKQTNFTQDLVILWRNRPTVVIGRNQNLAVEINDAFIAEKDIRVVRRLSGGGAVYHDLGNLNFSFITAAPAISRDAFARLTLPVLDALASFGVEAEFTGRNDLTISGQKFSGNAQYFHQGRLLHHGTLLFDSDLTVLSQALSGSESKHTRRAVPSVRSAVTTIRPHLPLGTTAAEFEAALLDAIFSRSKKPYQQYSPSPSELQAIEALARDRYRTRAWTYGSLPHFNHCVKRTFSGGTVEVLLDIKNETIVTCKICGDFFVSGEISDLETALCGVARTQEEIRGVLFPWLQEHPIDNITAQEVLGCFFTL